MIPERYKKASLNDFDDKKIRPVLEWYYGEKTEILLIIGGSGSGKTHLLSALCNEANTDRNKELDKTPGGFSHYGDYKIIHLSGAYVLIPEIALELRNSMQSDRYGSSEMDVINKYRKKTLIGFFDDLAANKPSDYVAESLYAIINHRYQQLSPSAYTSNLAISQISEIYGDRIASRLASGVVFNMGDKDRRIE